MLSEVVLRCLASQPYQPTWRAMREFTKARDVETCDEIWLLEHEPVFTLGQAGRLEHVLAPGEIPLVRSDRGGQVTYHGPGQLVVYLLLDLQRRRTGVRRLVAAIEQSIVKLLAAEGVEAQRRPGAPGVYVGGKKIAALGLRVRRGCCYHGLALNVNMDLEPFERIHPCGYVGLPVTQLAELGIGWSRAETGRRLLPFLIANLGYAGWCHSDPAWDSSRE